MNIWIKRLAKVAIYVAASFIPFSLLASTSAEAVGTLSEFAFTAFDDVGFEISEISGSKDGKYIIAISSPKPLISSDFGATWSPIVFKTSGTPITNFGTYVMHSVDISDDGGVMVVAFGGSADDPALILVSVDHGNNWFEANTWSITFSSKPLNADMQGPVVAVSGDGNHLYFGASNTQMYEKTFSSGSWSAWQVLKNSRNSMWREIHPNYSGQLLNAINNEPGTVISTDSGVSWSLI